MGDPLPGGRLSMGSALTGGHLGFAGWLHEHSFGSSCVLSPNTCQHASCPFHTVTEASSELGTLFGGKDTRALFPRTMQVQGHYHKDMGEGCSASSRNWRRLEEVSK